VWRKTRNLVEPLVSSVVKRLEEFVKAPVAFLLVVKVAVKYAGDALKKLAWSFASLYFSLVTRRSSVIVAP